MGVLMKPMDFAWSLLKADPDYRVRDPKTPLTGSLLSQAMHPAIAGHLHRRLNRNTAGLSENQLAAVPSPFGEQTETVAGRFPRSRLRHMPQEYTDMPTDKMKRMFGNGPMAQLETGMDTRDYGRGSKAPLLSDKAPGVSVSNQPDSTPDAVLNLLQIPGAAPSPMNYFQTDFRPYEPQEYGQMSPRDSEDFEEVFNRFMEQQGRRSNPDNVQMLPGNVMQQM